MARTIIVRGVDEHTYEILWRMRRAFKVRSWAELLRKIALEYEQITEEAKWL